MFDSPSDLSSDLEWMLQSGQVSPETLLEALMEEFYGRVFHLALSFLDDGDSARRVTQEVFARALQDVYRYQDQIGVDFWIFSLVLHACQKARNRQKIDRVIRAVVPKSPKKSTITSWDSVKEEAMIWSSIDSMDETDRWLFLLHYLHGWDEVTIARHFNIDKGEVENRLRNSIRNLFISIHKHTALLPGKSVDLDRESLEELIRRAIGLRWPAPEFSTDELQAQFREIINRFNRGKGRRSATAWIKEVSIIAVLIAATAISMWGLSRLWPEEDTQTTENGETRITQIVYVDKSTPAIVFSTPAPRFPSATPLPYDSLYFIQPGDSLEALQTQMGFPLKEIMTLNRIPTDGELSAGRYLLIPKLLTPAPTFAATPVTPLPQFLPFERAALPNDIITRMKLAQIVPFTVWFDAHFVDYGPQSFIGPLRIMRIQAWLSQDQLIMVLGSLESVSEVWMQTGEAVFFAKPGSGQPWFLPWDVYQLDSDMEDAAGQVLESILQSDRLGMNTTLQIGERETIAGRSTITVDVLDQDHQREALFWLDDRTGLVLRKQFFTGDGASVLQRELVITDIEYDVDLPQELFDIQLPWRGDYSFDASGKPELNNDAPSVSDLVVERKRLEYLNAPENMDATHSNLLFQYPPRYTESQSRSRVSVFADGFYLGIIPFGNPWEMICSRSPNGARLAFVSNPEVYNQRDGGLNWFSLDEPLGFVDKVLEENLVTQFSFAPDNQRLAAFGRHDEYSKGELFIIDTETGQVKPMMELADAKSLVWSTDGKQLGMIVRYELESFEDHILVIRVADGTVTYKSPVDLLSGNTRDWPMLEWGIDFPVVMGGLDDCARPPE